MPRIGRLDLPDSTPHLTTQSLALRPPTETDAVTLLAVYHEADVLKFLNRTNPLTAQTLQFLIKQWPAVVASDYRHSFVIHLATTDEVIGMVELDNFDPGAAIAEVTIFIGQAYRRKGYGGEALKAVLDWGIGEMNLSRIDGVVMPGNVGSMALLQSVGMIDQGDRVGRTVFGEPLPIRHYSYFPASQKPMRV